MKLFVAIIAATFAVPHAAMAQAAPRAPGAQTRVVPVPKQAPPPALPGARAEPTTSTPAEKTTLDLPPNEALFDAINRGDLATAKDSLNRGADLNARNVLGLTPLDLAVDLGRNQISFLLLSLRGGAGYGSGQPPPSTGAAPARQTRAQRIAAARATREDRSDTQPVAARASAGAAMPAPRRFAGDGGAPVPQAGFLGFDTNARR